MIEARLLDPKEGITYTLDETFLTNKPNERPPTTYWLFMERVIGKRRSRFVHEIVAATPKLANDELLRISERSDVKRVQP